MNLPAILSSGIAAISIIITIIIIVLLFLQKFKQKTEEIDKISIKWTIPYIILILLSICLIGTTIGTKYEIGEEENMDDIVMDINPIIESARQRLNSINIKKIDIYYYRSDDSFKNKFEADNAIDILRQNYEHGYRSFVATKHMRANNITKWMRTLVPDACAHHFMVSDPKFMIADTYNFNRKVQEFFLTEVKPIISGLEINFYSQLRAEFSPLVTRQSDDVKSKTVNGIDMRQKMLDNFELDMNNTQITRREWVEKMIEKLPDKQNIIKKTIILSCIINIILSAISILIIVFGQKLIGKRILGKVEKILVIVIGLISIVISLIVIILSLDIFEKCSLNEKNFGINDFLSPIPGNESITICQSRDLSFYADLGNDTAVTFDERIKEFDKLKDQYKSLLLSKLHKITFSQEYTTLFDAMKTPRGKVGDVCDHQCFQPNETEKLCEYRDLLEGIRHGHDDIIKPTVEKFNQFFENPDEIIYNTFVWYRTKVFNIVNTDLIKPIQEEMLATDFPCSLLVDKFINTGQSICQQVDIPIDIFYIYLTLLVGLFIAHLIINTMMLKYSFNGNGTIDSHNKSTPQQSPSNNV